VKLFHSRVTFVEQSSWSSSKHT